MAKARSPSWIALGLLLAATAFHARSGASQVRPPTSTGPALPIGTDSAGILIVVSAGRVARAQIPWSVDSLPYLQVGRVEGETPYLFDGIRDVSPLADGSIMVVDGASRDLRIFDREGRFIRAAGGRGRGPGEFEAPRMVPTPGAPSMLFFDRLLRRFTQYDAQMRDPRVVQDLSAAATQTRDAVGVTADHVLSREVDVLGGARRGVPDGLYFTPWTFKWVHVATGEASVQINFKGPAQYRARERSMTPPYQIMAASGTVASDGFYLAEGVLPEVRHYDVEGHLDRILRIDEPRRRVTEAQFKAELDAELRRLLEHLPEYTRAPDDPARYRQLFAEAQTAYRELDDLSIPSFDALEMDAQGWLWARIYEPRRADFWTPADAVPNQWMLFSPAGEARGTIGLPRGFAIEYIGGDFILGVRRAEYDVEIVEAYRLRRER